MAIGLPQPDATLMKLQIQEITIELNVSSPSPRMLDLDLLDYAGVIDRQELLSDSVRNQYRRWLRCQDGVNIIIQPERIAFSEPVGVTNEIADIKTPGKALAYLEGFSQIDYQTLSIYINSQISFESKQDWERYLSQSILTDASWQKASLIRLVDIHTKLIVDNDEVAFSLSLEKSSIRNGDRLNYFLSFLGKFEYKLGLNQIDYFKEKIHNHQIHLNKYQKFISDNFFI